MSWIWAVSWGRPCEGLWGILNWDSQEIHCEHELTIRVLDASIGQITETDVDDNCEEDRGEHRSEWWLASCNRLNCAYHEVGTGLGSLEPRTHNLYQFSPLQLPVRDENYRGQARLI
jgi:hypothetical protein